MAFSKRRWRERRCRVDDGVLVGAVKHVKGCIQRQQASTDLQGSEMGAEEDDAPPLLQCGLKVFESGERHEFAESSVGSPPTERGFDQRDAERSEVGIQQSMAFARGEFREAQADIGQGDMSAISRQSLDETSQAPPDGELPGIGQSGYAPQQTGCEPGDSVPNPVP